MNMENNQVLFNIDNPTNEYKELLMDFTKEELTEIRKMWGFTGLSQLNKEKLAERLVELIPEEIEEWVFRLTEEIYSPLKTLSHYNEGFYLIDKSGTGMSLSGVLQDYGLVCAYWDENDVQVYMPELISEKLQDLIQNNSDLEGIIYYNSNLIKMTIGILVYYGIVEIDDMIAKINQLDEYNLEKNWYVEVLAEYSKALGMIEVAGDEIYLSMLESPELIKEERSKRPDISTYQIDFDEIWYANDYLYPEPNQKVQKFMDFLENEIDLKGRDFQTVLIIIYFELNNLTDIDIVMSNIADFIGLSINSKIYQKYKKLFRAMAWNLHYWTLKARTPSELQREAPGQIINKDKVVSLAAYKYKKEI
ncbi:MAG: hypothetical protein ABR596_00965 [Halarsenatibacteraceae bacterium]